MIKRIVPLFAAIALAATVTAPAALAEGGNGHRAKAGQAKLRKAVEQARKACAARKDSAGKPGKAHRQQCAKAAQRLLAALRQAEQRVEQLEAKLSRAVEEKCDGSADASKCDRLRQRLEKLRALETKLHEAIEKLESRLANSGESQTTGSSNQNEQVSDEEIESVEELAEELAAAGK